MLSIRKLILLLFLGRGVGVTAQNLTDELLNLVNDRLTEGATMRYVSPSPSPPSALE